MYTLNRYILQRGGQFLLFGSVQNNIFDNGFTLLSQELFIINYI